MARANGAKTEVEQPSLAVDEEVTAVEPVQPPTDAQEIDDCLNALKALLSTVEKLQKVRQEVGDIKPLVVRMLEGEIMSGNDLEQLKVGVGGLSRLVRAYTDHQTALTNAQPARTLLDQVLKGADQKGADQSRKEA
ncbi:MAG TPA: hypothetical protein V6D10_25905 [Trichocoleus sp.]|jgi:dsDNA-specific endonuclease/ATPase MutS2